MIENLFRKDLKEFKSYEAEKSSSSISMDANESFISLSGELKNEIMKTLESALYNRYPDPNSTEICKLYADYAGVDYNNVMAGNGSDELIQIIVNTFVCSGDKVIYLNPDFSMYSIYTKLAGGIPVEFPLDKNFKFDIDRFIEKVNSENAKLVFVSNPNNPTGGVLPEEDVKRIIESCRAIVVIDEAYFEFYGRTVADKINSYDNLIVTRTCSKAVGLAAIRLGFLITNELLLKELRKLKPPYNVNSITQLIGEVVLKRPEVIKDNIKTILEERKYLIENLGAIKDIAVYPTNANFVLIQSNNAESIVKKAKEFGIKVRSFSDPTLSKYLRVTVGCRKENTAFIKTLAE